MRLAHWIKQNGITASEFAGRVGVDKATVSRWLGESEATMPRRETLARIAEVTGGQVTANDFMGESLIGGADTPSASRPAPTVAAGEAAE
jgi:transcriptional regulator with XRE-family HTH domain